MNELGRQLNQQTKRKKATTLRTTLLCEYCKSKEDLWFKSCHWIKEWHDWWRVVLWCYPIKVKYSMRCRTMPFHDWSVIPVTNQPTSRSTNEEPINRSIHPSINVKTIAVLIAGSNNHLKINGWKITLTPPSMNIRWVDDHTIDQWMLRAVDQNPSTLPVMHPSIEYCTT